MLGALVWLVASAADNALDDRILGLDHDLFIALVTAFATIAAAIAAAVIANRRLIDRRIGRPRGTDSLSSMIERLAERRGEDRAEDYAIRDALERLSRRLRENTVELAELRAVHRDGLLSTTGLTEPEDFDAAGEAGPETGP